VRNPTPGILQWAASGDSKEAETKPPKKETWGEDRVLRRNFRTPKLDRFWVKRKSRGGGTGKSLKKGYPGEISKKKNFREK